MYFTLWVITSNISAGKMLNVHGTSPTFAFQHEYNDFVVTSFLTKPTDKTLPRYYIRNFVEVWICLAYVHVWIIPIRNLTTLQQLSCSHMKPNQRAHFLRYGKRTLWPARNKTLLTTFALF